MKKIAAFFDVDGTLYRDSLMIEHFKKMIKYEILDPVIWHGSAKKKFEDWDKRHGDYEDYLLEIAEIYINSMKGLNKEYINFITDQVINLKGERVYRYTRDRILWHQNNGHEVIFISGSPSFLVERMAKKYHVKRFTGTKYIVDEKNSYTGEIIPMWESKSKLNVINKYVKELNIEMDRSYAYGDTNGDLNMLKLVGNPVAINPIKKLVMNIKNDPILREKTTIIIERKDVIYKIPVDFEIL